MFTIQVAYEDLNGKKHNEQLYFHMMVPEWADLEFNATFDGSMSDYVKDAMQSGEGAKIYTLFKMLVANSYGRRTEDGAFFQKDPKWTEEFLNRPGWEQFFLWLTDDPKNAQKFWEGIFPAAMQEKVAELEKAQGKTKEKRLSELTKEELVELMQKQLAEKKPANEV